MANKSWREIFGEWVHGVIENGFQRSRLGNGLEVMLVLGHQRAVIPHFTLRFHRIGDVAVGGWVCRFPADPGQEDAGEAGHG